tara:strand:+ start:383 stop:661 length:279 start_codon:yes stop_codon:yes gene_type:complete
MAKRKTPKMTNLRPDKITDGQLQKMQSLVKNINSSQNELGIMETRKHNLLHQIFELQGYLNEMQQEFQKEYGTTNVNIADGTISYDDGKADS